MSDQAFADATRPAPRVVLRVAMLEYSLGHELLLQQQGNPLVTLGFDEFEQLEKEKQIAAVMAAVLICSRGWEKNKRPDKWVRFWGWMVRRADWEREILEFRIYRAEGSTFPRMADPSLGGQERSGEGRTLGAPFLSRLTAYGVGAFGERAFDLPLGMVQWMYFAQAELEGSCMVENEREREIREGIEQHQADYRREVRAGLASGAGVAKDSRELVPPAEVREEACRH